jgi:hypothetical protein
MVDKIRRVHIFNLKKFSFFQEELQVDVTSKHLPKLVVICFYGVLTLVLYAWVRYISPNESPLRSSVQDESDPVYGVQVTGVQVLYYITSVIWTGIIIWVIVLGNVLLPLNKYGGIFIENS